MRLFLAFLCALVWFVTPLDAQTPIVPYGQSTVGQLPTAVQWTPVLLNSLGGTVTSVKSNGPARLAYVYCYNSQSSVSYIQIFDAATSGAVTLGSTTPKLSLGIPATSASGLGPAEIGIQFQNGIQVASTSSATGASAASQDCNVAYN